MTQSTQKIISDAMDHAFNSLTSNLTIAQTQEIDPQKIEAFYALGYNNYIQKDFAKAEEIFSFAYRLDSTNPKIIKGLAATFKMQGKFQEALQAYALVGMLDLEDPESSFHAAECFFALDDHPSCLQALEAAEGLAQGDPEHQDLIEQVEKMKANLKE